MTIIPIETIKDKFHNTLYVINKETNKGLKQGQTVIVNGKVTRIKIIRPLESNPKLMVLVT